MGEDDLEIEIEAWLAPSLRFSQGESLRVESWLKNGEAGLGLNLFDSFHFGLVAWSLW